ncbi:protein MAK16 [Vairimorpha necatrix]|uniref:Protein MAK16 n=1 Tax=Vairimorpha necatrix TaxID=6039 RepID=A0AAX4JDT0_9MICR
MLDNSIWKNIGGKKFCSFKKKTETEFLCKNKNNLTGLCNEFSCPLANTKYATIRAIDEELYLFLKEPERINTPNEQYEKIKLSKNYEEALKQIDEELEHWDKQIIHKCKQKHTKLTEYLERLEYFKEHGRTEYMKKVKRKVTRAEKLAALSKLDNLDFEKQIGEELLLRLESGVYGEAVKDRYHKVNEQFIEEKKNAKKKKKYVAHYENEEDLQETGEIEASKEEESKEKKKKKTKKEKMTW